MIKFSAAATAMLLAIGSANAADLVIIDPGAPVMMSDVGFDWSGVYAGVIAGYTGGHASSSGATSGVTTDIPFSGGLLGATAGYNAQLDGFVLGIEGDVAWSSASGTATCEGNAAYDCEGNLDWLGTIRGRAGVAMDGVLVFATAGFAAAGVTANINPDAPAIDNTFSGTMTGWTVGGGVEAAVTDTISIKAEYNYLSLGHLQAPEGTLSGEAVDLSATSHVIKAGVNFHF